jgi:PAS domain S-box-containing protein
MLLVYRVCGVSRAQRLRGLPEARRHGLLRATFGAPTTARLGIVPLSLRSEDYAALLDGAPDAIVVVDEAATIRFVNQRTADLFGWAPEELIGRRIEVLVPDRLHASHVGNRSRYISSPSVRPMGSGRELFARRRDGTEFPVEISLSPLRTTHGLLVSSIIRDVSERVQREEELRRMRSLADAANAAKSEFLSSMSHELRTPLNAVLGFAQLLHRSRRNPLDAQQLGMLDHIVKGGEHLLRLIDEVLDLARIEAGGVSISTEPVGVADVLVEVTSALQPVAARAGIEIVVEPLLAHTTHVMADRTRLVQILMNFGSNAVKYGRQGGHVRFVGASTEAGNVRLSVIDDGIGIPPDKHDLVFQPFQRAGQEMGTIEGTGIGLAITKRLAELMGGSLGFESEHGSGSEFWVELPSTEIEARGGVSAPMTLRAEAPLLDGKAQAIKVVYVEDNPANVELMVHLLSEFERIELLTALTAEAGIELVRRHRPTVVIMDVNLPGMSGIEATRRLREWPETREIPVIGLSAAAMPRDRELATEVGFFRYLTKPFDVEDMISALEAVLERNEL